MFPGDGVLSIISSVGRRDSVLRTVRIFHPLPRCVPVLWAVMAISMLAAPAVAQDQNAPATLTIAAERDTHILGFDDVSFVLTRSGETAAALDVGVKLTQTADFLDAGTLVQTAIFAPGAASATLTIPSGKFLSGATGTGSLTAAVAPGDKTYKPGVPSSATTRIVAANPAVTVRHAAASYAFAEGADATNRAAIVARTADGVPRPGSAFRVALSTRAVAGGAAAPGDYATLSEEIAFAPDDFAAEGGAWQARKEVALSVVDDSEAEEPEALDLVLDRSPGLPNVVALRQADGTTPCGTDGCAARVTIGDDDEDPHSPSTITSIAFASPAETYAIADQIAFWVIFDKPVTVTGTRELEPELEIDIGGTERRAFYWSGSGGVALLFGYNVVEGDRDTDGVAVGPDPLRAVPGSLAGPGGTGVSLSHPGLSADPAHKVDGVRPTPMFAMVDDGKVAVTWDEPLMIEEGPGLPGGFVLVIGGVTRAIDGVAIDDRRLTLGVSPAVEESEWVTVSYTPPDARPVRDLAGNRAAGFSLTVTAGERGICQRTPVVRERIMVLLRHAVRPGYWGDCAGVTATMLARIRSMDIVPPLERVTALRPGDFAGLSGLRSLYIVEHSGLTVLETGVFRGMDRLETLYLHRNAIETVRAGAFRGLAALRLLHLGSNRIASLAPGTFEGLGALEYLSLRDNRLTAFPFDEFEGLPRLGHATDRTTGLSLSGNPGYRNGVQATRSSLTVARGESASYRLRLTAAPSTAGARVTVSAPSGLTVAPEAIAFDGRGKDWFRAREVVLTAAPEAAPGEALVTHEVTPPNYASRMPEAAPSLTVQIAGAARSTSPALSVADAEVREGPGAALAFAVALAPAQTEPVTVDWSTADGTALAGADYEAGSGTLVFRPGETAKTVSVAVIDDSHDEGPETMTLTLAGASGAAIADASATGTIVNADRMPAAWLVRFGRTAADQVLAAVSDRMAATRGRGFAAGVSGTRIGEASSGRETRTIGGRGILDRSHFALSGGTEDGETGAIWGRGAVTRFDGREGALSLGGDVATGMLGGDWTNGKLTAGLVISSSRGRGEYRAATGGGEVESSLAGVWPWGRYALGRRLSVWLLGGYGEGSLTLTPSDGAAIDSEIGMRALAGGLRGELIAPPENSGFALAATSDALLLRMSSDAAPGLAASETRVTRIRLGLEGAWRGLDTGAGRLIPSFETGLRHDGGDAETGFGLDLGAGIAWEDPGSGIRATVKARGLLAHADGDFRERGLSASLAWHPDPATAFGPSASLRHSLGAAATGGKDALLRHGVPTRTGGGTASSGRFEARFGYGLELAGGYLAGTPELAVGLSDAGRELSLAWHVAPAAPDRSDLDFRVEGTRRDGARSGPEHAIRLRMTLRK